MVNSPYFLGLSEWVCNSLIDPSTRFDLPYRLICPVEGCKSVGVISTKAGC